MPVEPEPEPAFLAESTASAERLELLEQRLQETEGRAGREREAAERLSQEVAGIQERVTAALEHLAVLGDRLGTLEKGISGLHEALGAFHQRIEPVESAGRRFGDLEGSLHGIENAVRGLEERFGADSSRQRKDSDDLGMALHALNDRIQTMDQQIAVLLSQTGSHEDQMTSVRYLAETIPQLEARVAALPGLSDRVSDVDGRLEAAVRQHRELEATFDEKTQLGRREAEDIRSQIAPLLEERVRRHESDALLFSEMDRLRESLAESLHDLAERLRQAVR